MDVESELALHGYADPPTSLFRGCHICFLPLIKPQRAAETGAADDSHTHAASAVAISPTNAASAAAVLPTNAASAAAALPTNAASGHDGLSNGQLFESTLKAAAVACVTQEALLQCQANRIALQVCFQSLS